MSLIIYIGGMDPSLTSDISCHILNKMYILCLQLHICIWYKTKIMYKTKV